MPGLILFMLAYTSLRAARRMTTDYSDPKELLTPVKAIRAKCMQGTSFPPKNEKRELAPGKRRAMGSEADSRLRASCQLGRRATTGTALSASVGRCAPLAAALPWSPRAK